LPLLMNWLRMSPGRGWMKLKRRGVPKRHIASHCRAGALRRSSLRRLSARQKPEKSGDGGTPSLPGNVHFYWADERCVPPDDPESNFKLADELLFRPLKIPNAQIHRIHGEDSPATAVQGAGSGLRQIALPGENGQPVLDLIFLGMGEDGHARHYFQTPRPRW